MMTLQTKFGGADLWNRAEASRLTGIGMDRLRKARVKLGWIGSQDPGNCNEID